MFRLEDRDESRAPVVAAPNRRVGRVSSSAPVASWANSRSCTYRAAGFRATRQGMIVVVWFGCQEVGGTHADQQPPRVGTRLAIWLASRGAAGCGGHGYIVSCGGRRAACPW